MPKVDRNEIEVKLKEIFFKEAGIKPDNIKLNSSLVDDLGIDSFGAIELVFAMEEEFKIEIPDVALKDVRVVRDIVEYIKLRLDEKN